MIRHPFRTPAAAGIVAVVLLGAGCTGTTSKQDTGSTQPPGSKPASGSNQPTGSSTQQVRLKFWHGWSQPHEVKAIQANIAAFEKLPPNIKIVATPNVTDDKILQGIRGGNGADVVSSFTTDNVGQFCNGAFLDLNPMLATSGVDKNSAFVKTMVDYTQYKGKQCTLPLLGDAFGLYYNKDLFAAAGISSPPKTWAQFTADAVKLTKQQGDTYKQLGFMPTFHSYESTPAHYLAQWGPQYFTTDGKSNLANDPAVEQMLTYQRSLVDALGGFGRLEKYRATFGDEFSPQNAFEAGKVAMAMDGEWRIANLKADGVKFHWAAAPLPVPDDQEAKYGRGYVSGTVIGIGRTSKHQQAAWELVKFLTTDPTALVAFATAIDNVPSTPTALLSPALRADPNFRVFTEVVGNPDSNTTPASPNGGQYQTSLQNFSYKVEAGKVRDIHAGLQSVDREIDAATAQAKS